MSRTASATPYAIQVDGHDLFLFAGDWPYCRLPRQRWAETLAELAAADLNAVVLSVPWNWHEPDEGEFDLQGESDPRRDLQGALDLCAEHNLYAIVRPGPHIGSNWQNGGIPDWLLNTHPEILALDAHGRPAGLEMCCPPITYLHPVYQAYVAGWYQACLPLLRRSLISEQGTIVAVEIDHRPSYWWGLQEGDPLFVDYNPWVIGQDGRPGLYQRWLAAQYGDVERLNRRYGTSYAALAAVQPPRRPPASYHELPWFSDWRRCKMDLLNQHLEYLYDWLRAGGVDVPIVVVYPYQSPLAARYCVDYFRLRGKPVLAAHAPGCPPSHLPTTGAGLGQVVGSAELARSWVKGTALPPAGLEALGTGLAGTHSDGAEVLWALQLGHGLNALGLAPLDNGGRSEDRSEAQGSRGDLCPHDAAIRHLGKFLKTHGERLVRTEPLADVALGWYEPYEDCGQQGDARAFGWRDDYRAMLLERFGLACDGRRPAGGDLLSLMAMSGLSFAMLDLQRDPLEEWLEYPQLWVLGLDFMAASVQRELISYVRAGGHLVMLPRVPYLDEHLQPCPLLDALFPSRPIKLPAGGRAGDRHTACHTVSLNTGGNVRVAGDLDTFELPAGSTVLARAWQGCRPCAYRTVHGRGTATLLGFTLAPQDEESREHKRFINQLAAQARVRRHATSEAMNLHVVERATPAGSPDPAGYLFVVNPLVGPAASRLTYTNPRTGAEALLPRLLEGIEFEGQGALTLCLETPIPATRLTIAYCTSQVQGWTVEEGCVTLALYGPPQTMGELALRLAPGTQAPPTGVAHWQRQSDEAGDLWLLTYPHQEGATILHLQA